MRKRMILFSVILGLVLAGCAKSVETDYADPDLGITLTAKNVTPCGMTVVCTQSGGEATGELNTGSWYRLESMDGKEPDYIVDGEIGWDSMAYFVPMEDTVEWTIDWAWLYGELPSGEYRICKEFMDFRETGDFDKTLVY
ncbi:MAG: hypothetical protein IJD13_08620, partial [Oscillospiraceae bacterium]|nr:hypothetical protein [Oscillospiraceae bacterium]